MAFPFIKHQGDYDISARIANTAISGALIVVGGISLALITNVALKALGFSALSVSFATAIPTTIGAFGAAVIGFAAWAGIIVTISFVNALRSR